MKAKPFLLVCTIVLAVAVPAWAEFCRDIQGGLSNFDVRNGTGQTANDFEVILYGVEAAKLNNLYTGDYPDVQVTPVAGGVKVRWTGSSTAPGTWDHFGIGLNGNVNPTSTEFYWTFDGGQLPLPPPRTWQNWQVVGGVARDVIWNWASHPMWVQRRILTQPGEVSLEDLMRGGSLWNQATVIDTSRVQIGHGGSLNWDFPITSDISYLMMYDVFDSVTGGRTMTFLNAAKVCPEPASLIALICGLGTVMLRRKR
jgi:hypothetical protein